MLAAFVAGRNLYIATAMGVLATYTALGPARFIILRNGFQSIRRRILNQDVLVSASALGGLVGGATGLVIADLPAGGLFGATVFVLWVSPRWRVRLRARACPRLAVGATAAGSRTTHRASD